MANYQNYTTNVQNNGDVNQFNADINQNNAHMFNNLIHTMDFNQGNKMVYAIPAGNFNFAQPIPNAFHTQYPNGINNGLLQSVYLSNPQQFMNVENYNNGMQQFIPAHNFPQAMVQVDVNAINKNVQQRQVQSRKRSYVDQSKQESGEVEYDHKNRPLIYSCKECPRKFSMNSRLNTHMRCHNGERPHVCHTCNFAFTQKSYLVRHAAVHKEERPYQCHACKKTYKHYGSLANHRKTHKNGRNDVSSELAVEEIPSHQNMESESAVNNFQNHDFIFAEQLKQEPQQANMATDLSTQYQTSEQTISYLEQLNQYPQTGICYNTDTTEAIETSSNPTATFTI